MMKYMCEIDDSENEIDGMIEFTLDSNQINKLVSKLNELQDSKEHFHFEVNNIASLLVHHNKDELLNIEENNK